VFVTFSLQLELLIAIYYIKFLVSFNHPAFPQLIRVRPGPQGRIFGIIAVRFKDFVGDTEYDFCSGSLFP